MVTVLKTVVPFVGTVGSNPTPSAILRLNLKKLPPNWFSIFEGTSGFANKLLTGILVNHLLFPPLSYAF